MSKKWQLLRGTAIDLGSCRVFDRDKNRIFIVFFWFLLFFISFFLRPDQVSKSSLWAAPDTPMPDFAPALERQLFHFYPARGEPLFFPPYAEDYLRSALQVLYQSGIGPDEGGAVVQKIFVGRTGKYLGLLLQCYDAYQRAERDFVNSLEVSVETPLPDLNLAPLQKRYFGEPLARALFPLDWSDEFLETAQINPFDQLAGALGCAGLGGASSNDP